jgi:hypothetical protein
MLAGWIILGATLFLSMALIIIGTVTKKASTTRSSSTTGSASTTRSASTTKKASNDCLCVFDIDRTITSFSGQTGECEGSYEGEGIDTSYGCSNTIRFAEGAKNTVQGCLDSGCKVGIVTDSSNTFNGKLSTDRSELDDIFSGTGIDLDNCTSVNSSCQSSAQGGTKAQRIKNIGNADTIYFFDDSETNREAVVQEMSNVKAINPSGEETPEGDCLEKSCGLSADAWDRAKK